MSRPPGGRSRPAAGVGRANRSGPPPVDPARRVAYDLLRAVAERDAYANLALPGLLAERGLTGRSAALATELGYGTLRWRGLLDSVLARCVDRSLDAVDGPALDLLRLGTYQLLETRIPSHAAVSATVDLARVVRGPGVAGFVNAVLRRVGRRDRAGWLAETAPAESADPVGHLEVVTSHPRWVVHAVLDALGGDLAEARRALDADNVRPAVHLVARPGRTDRADLLAAAGPQAGPGRYSPYAVVLDGGDPGQIAAVRSGAAAVQDEGSQLAALALVAAPVDAAERAWLDLCAGPGGKAALLAGVAGAGGPVLLAVELAARRAGLVAGALAGGPAPAFVVRADGTAPPVRPGSFDRVLVDAPCSGLGALRRRPEARWRRAPADLPGLGRLQRALLGRALESARPGGVVGYVTCSPHLAETRAVVADAVRASAGVAVLDAPALLAGFGVAEADAGELAGGRLAQLWPHRHGTDAMFVAVLRRGTGPH